MTFDIFSACSAFATIALEFKPAFSYRLWGFPWSKNISGKYRFFIVLFFCKSFANTNSLNWAENPPMLFSSTVNIIWWCFKASFINSLSMGFTNLGSIIVGLILYTDSSREDALSASCNLVPTANMAISFPS